MKKILIALDIDGTLTTDLRSVPQTVRSYLASLVEEGHLLALITGRCFSLAAPVLKDFNFPYLLGLHNGAIILQMPGDDLIFSQYMDPGIINVLDSILASEGTDYAIYTGVENQDLCYYRADKFSPFFQDFLKRRALFCREKWLNVKSFETVPLHLITSIKLFGDFAAANRLQQLIEKNLSLHISVIRDPFDEKIYLAQATHPDVNKGTAIRKILQGNDLFVIAAGDDVNDLPMLRAADISIAMETAPETLKQIAHRIAKPASVYGIIQSLEEVLFDVRNHRL